MHRVTYQIKELAMRNTRIFFNNIKMFRLEYIPILKKNLCKNLPFPTIISEIVSNNIK